MKRNVGFLYRLDGKIAASAHGNRLLFFRFFCDFQSMAELRCTPREYGLSAILRASNDALPDKSHAIGKIANTADADRGFLEQKQGCFSRNRKIGGF